MFRFLVLSALMVCAFGNGILPRFVSPAGRIVGGKDTTIENHPYQVSVRRDGFHDCGGSIIGSKKVLTAAHCCYPTLTIQYGVTKMNTNENVISVAKMIPHPSYNDSGFLNHDICVLLLDEEIPFGESANLIKLAEEEPSVGTKVVATGWGDLKEREGLWEIINGNAADILQEVELKIIDREDCKLANAEVNNVDNSMICAGVSGGGKDACSGDSGGPLVVDNKLVGVVSWGYGCARPEYPGVYANVAGLRDWIDSQ